MGTSQRELFAGQLPSFPTSSGARLEDLAVKVGSSHYQHRMFHVVSP